MEQFKKKEKEKKSIKIFLAGSIDMGTSIYWYDKIIKDIAINKDVNYFFFVPRRIENFTDDMHFEQITWELNLLEKSDYIYMYFLGNSKSPISMLEFGLFIKECPEKITVFCPEEFWRYKNIEITAAFYEKQVVFNNYGKSIQIQNKKIREFLDKKIEVEVGIEKEKNKEKNDGI